MDLHTECFILPSSRQNMWTDKKNPFETITCAGIAFRLKGGGLFHFFKLSLLLQHVKTSSLW